MLRECPFTGVKFLPKRKNQVFATAKNRRDFHNEVAAEIRRAKSYLDKPLERNFILLSELVPTGVTKVFEREYLLSQGFNPNVLTHLQMHNGKTCPCLYHFVIIASNTNQLTILNSKTND